MNDSLVFKHHEILLIVDFGSQYTQLIARCVRELGVYCEVVPWHVMHEGYCCEEQVCGVILSGGTERVVASSSSKFSLSCCVGRVPVLGIGYGAQLLVHHYGEEVVHGEAGEYGRVPLHIENPEGDLFSGVEEGSEVWMVQGDTVPFLPEGWMVDARSDLRGIVAFSGEVSSEAGVYGLLFHPEVSYTECGRVILRNFLYSVCGFHGDWTTKIFIEESVHALREQLGEEGVVMALSGGVDSTVAAVLLHRAVGSRLHCIFVNHGLLRAGEYDEVLRIYRNLGLSVEGVDAQEVFFSALEGVEDPELKRKAVGRCFVETFECAAKGLQGVRWLGQGTIYPDVIESLGVGEGKVIKSHHNVGGLPEQMSLQVVEPLRYLFKDEVRRLGVDLGIPAHILGRHPFPGPGLSIRVLGEVTRARVAILQAADAIYIEELQRRGLYDKIWQAGAILLPVRTVGMKGDTRTYESVVALRAVVSVDGMTADWYPLPHDALGAISTRIMHEVKGVNRVVYDVSAKPPATIEWE